MNTYKDPQGEAVLRLVVKPENNGTFLRVFAPFVYNLKDSSHRDAGFQALLIANFRTNMVQFEFDPNDGEVRAGVEIPVEDAVVTQRQLRAILHGIASIVDEADPFVRGAIESGKVEHEAWIPGMSPQMAQMMALVQKAGGLDAARKPSRTRRRGRGRPRRPSRRGRDRRRSERGAGALARRQRCGPGPCAVHLPDAADRHARTRRRLRQGRRRRAAVARRGDAPPREGRPADARLARERGAPAEEPGARSSRTSSTATSTTRTCA